MIEDARLLELLRAVADRGDEAWSALLVELEPVVAHLARNQPVGRLRGREDTPREIVLRVIARLHAGGFAAIKKLVAQDPPPVPIAWLRVLVRRSAIDYLRESPEFRRGNAEREHRWISLSTLRSDAPAQLEDSLVEKRREVIRFITEAVEAAEAEVAAHGEQAAGRLAAAWKISRTHVRRLVARGRQYLAVLAAIFEGRRYPEVAQVLGMTVREVELTARYIEELMRARSFR